MLPKAGCVRVQKGIHVLPAVQLSNPSNVSINNRLEGVPSPIAEDELFDMRWLDLLSVIEYVPRWSNKDLSEMQSCHVNLAVTQGDVNAILTGCRTDSAHFIRIRWQTVLPLGFQEGERLLVVDLPHPVGITWNPYTKLSVVMKAMV